MADTVWRGVAGSSGLALGPALVLRTQPAEETTPGAEDARAAGTTDGSELERWRAARRRVEETYAHLAERAREVVGPAEVAILEAQGLMAADPDLEEQVGAAVARGLSAEAATREAIAGYAAVLAGLDDEYLRQRADDVREIGRGILRALAGEDPIPLEALPPGSILCAQELAAGAMLLLDRSRLAGMALGSGGPTSHIAILARTLGVPAVLGLGTDFLAGVTTGTLVGVDGNAGEVIVAPSDDQLAAFEEALASYRGEWTEIAALVTLPATTPDGFHVDLFANIGGPGDVEAALAAGAEGVGLFRTEFLVTGRATLPPEDEQAWIYRNVVAAMGGRTVIFRTFDIGGDKPVPALALPEEMNPFLGYRALRIGLDRPELLRTQMRAILRAAEGGHEVWIMLPMVATVDEVRRARAIL